jgi:hypothetical protein
MACAAPVERCIQCTLRLAGVPASAGSGVPGRMRLPRQAFHQLMNFEMLLRTPPIWSPGFSRIRRSPQDAATPAGIPPAKAGTPGHSYPGYFLNVLQPDQAFPAGCRDPGRHPTG